MEREPVLQKMRRVAAETGFAIRGSQEGRILSVGDGVVQVAGLRDARLNEIIDLGGGSLGIVFDLHPERIGVVLLCGGDRLKAGEKAWKTERVATIDAGEGLLGRVVNPLGQTVDGGAPPAGLTPCSIERTAPSLVARDYVTAPLYTGIMVVDAIFSIGRGQRELIIGDPGTGKTSLAVDAIINQRDSDVICIYAAIGQKKGRVLKVLDQIGCYGDLSRTVIVTADATDSLGLQFLAPYSATAIAEYFLDRGKDVLVVYDDLSRHADAYRSLSLLLRRPPGREAYPGDIFFIHSRLLERSARLHGSCGGGSITALPIVETQQGRIASYIPTNLISITDGQIYLDSALFNKGVRPAVDVGRSVSRIGGKVQTQGMRAVAARVKVDYSRFLEVEIFTRFGARVEEETAQLIRRGERMREVLKQPRFRPFPPEEQVLRLMVLHSGALDACGLAAVAQRCAELVEGARGAFPGVVARLKSEGTLSESDLRSLGDFLARGG